MKPLSKPPQPIIHEEPEESFNDSVSKITENKKLADDFSSFENTPQTEVRGQANIFKTKNTLKPIQEEDASKEDSKSPIRPRSKKNIDIYAAGISEK